MELELSRAGREYFYWPFWSDVTLAGMEVSIGSIWVQMEAQPGYVPTDPVADDAQWFRVLVAGPAVDDNPAGTAVLAQSSPVRFRLVDTPEIIVRTDGLLRLI